MLWVRIPPGLPNPNLKESGIMSNVTTFFGRITSFLNEVVAEIKKTTWPSKDELVGSMGIVCIVVVIFAAILGAMDNSFSYVIRQLIG